MKLFLCNFDNVLGLKGFLNFVERKPLLIYGENIAGKSNIINVLRYCLIPKWKEKKGYAEEKRLKKNEMLLQKNSFGSVEIYFEQNKKLYKLYYHFSRRGKNVGQTQKMFESDLVELPSEDEERIKTLKRLRWRDLGTSNIKSLKEKFVEIGIYPEILDILISPSNVRNFSEAINGSVVRVPEVIAAKISNIHTNAGKYIDNLKKLHSIIVLEKEEFERRIKGLKAEFEDVSKNLPEINAEEIFVIGRITKNLENIRSSFAKELELIPGKVSEMREILRSLSSGKYEIWINAINKIVAIISKKEELKSLIEKEERFENAKKNLSEWKVIFEQLPPDSSPEGLLIFSLPKFEEFDFSILSSPDRIKSIFLHVRKAKSFLKKAYEICNKYKVQLKASEINNVIKSYNKLFEALNTPFEPKGDPALISKQEDKTVVSIPLDIALKRIDYLRGIETTPLIHRPEKLGKEEFEKKIARLQKEINTFRTELRKAKRCLSEARKLLKKVKQLKDSLGHEIERLKRDGERNKRNLEKLVDKWKAAYCHLCEVFKLTYEEIDLSSQDAVNSSSEVISKKYKDAERIFAEDLHQQLKNYPEIIKKYKGQKPMDIVKKVEEEFEKKMKEMEKRRQEYGKVNEWILSNNNTIKSLEDRNRTRDIMNIGIAIAREIFLRLQAKTNINRIIEELAEKIEENVRNVYDKIFPEDKSFSFEHLKEGRFLSTIGNEPITHPSGSQRVAISMGIMLSLAETFGLPIVLDEAFDRIDVNRLMFFSECITGIASASIIPNICLVGYTTFNIEKNPEVLSFVNNWKIYLIEKMGVLEKNIRLLKELSTSD